MTSDPQLHKEILDMGLVLSCREKSILSVEPMLWSAALFPIRKWFFCSCLTGFQMYKSYSFQPLWDEFNSHIHSYYLVEPNFINLGKPSDSSNQTAVSIQCQPLRFNWSQQQTLQHWQLSRWIVINSICFAKSCRFETNLLSGTSSKTVILWIWNDRMTFY